MLQWHNAHKAPNRMPTVSIPYNGSCGSGIKWSLYSVLSHILYLFIVLFKYLYDKVPTDNLAAAESNMLKTQSKIRTYLMLKAFLCVRFETEEIGIITLKNHILEKQPSADAAC